MTLILKLDLDMVKMCLYAKNELPSSNGSKVTVHTDTWTHRQLRHTDTQTDRPDWNYYLSAYADGKKYSLWIYLLPLQMSSCTMPSEDKDCVKIVCAAETILPSAINKSSWIPNSIVNFISWCRSIAWTCDGNSNFGNKLFFSVSFCSLSSD